MPEDSEKRIERRSRGRRNFLVHLASFKQMLEDGYTRREIYEDYSEKLGISYSRFCRYINDLIMKGVKNETPKSEVPVSQSANPPAKTPAPAPVPQKVEPAKQEKPAETPGAESAPRKGPVFVAPKPKPPYIHDPTKIDIDALIGRKR